LTFLSFRKDHPVDDIPHAMAKQLRAALNAARKLMRQPNLDEWAYAFRGLLDDVSEQDATRVLTWYCKTIGTAGSLKIYSAATFVDRYDEICERMRLDPNTIVISDAARDLAQELMGELWPGGSDQDLAACCQLSLDTHKAFIERLALVRAQLRGRVARFADQFLAECAQGGGRQFVRRWMDAVRQQIASWNRWRGSLMALAFDPASDRFVRFGRDVAVEWCGDSRRFDELVAKMNVKSHNE
jgi:hypothetical protein